MVGTWGGENNQEFKFCPPVTIGFCPVPILIHYGDFLYSTLHFILFPFIFASEEFENQSKKR